MDDGADSSHIRRNRYNIAGNRMARRGSACSALIMRSIKRLNVEIEYNSRLLNGPESDAIVKDFDTAFRYFNDTLRLGKKYVFGRGCARIIRYSEIAEAYRRHRHNERPRLECKLVENAESMGQDKYTIGTIGTIGEHLIGFGYEEQPNKPFDESRLQWEKIHLGTYQLPEEKAEKDEV